MLRYRNITKYRSVWMALAALWILYYHSSLPPKYYSSFLGYVRFFGFSGVDIFVFASGLGCYHSLTRHYDPIAFLKKRIIRILPSYYVVLTAWLIYQHLRSGISVSSVFANYLCVDFLAGADFQTLWYMNGVWIYYLFALFLVPLCQNASLRRKILLFFLCAAFSVPFSRISGSCCFRGCRFFSSASVLPITVPGTKRSRLDWPPRLLRFPALAGGFWCT